MRSPLGTHPGVRDLELTQDVLGHVVFGHRVNDKVLVASRALCWPVLVAFLLWTKAPPHEQVGRDGGGELQDSEESWDASGAEEGV